MTELVFILDRSGSMYGLEKDTVGGFNSLIEKQKRENGTALVSTVLFDKFLTTGDEALAIQVKADLDTWHASRAAEDERITASVEAAISAARPVKKPVARKRTTAKTAAKN